MPAGARPLAVVLAIEAVIAAALALVTLDLWAHRRVEQLGGVNVWGYRGSTLPQKHRDELRIALVGGDLAFGWGQDAGGTLISEIRRLVMLETDRPGRPLHPITGMNLGAQGLRPGGYAAWIDRFAYLGPDVVCIVADPPGYRSRRGYLVPDRESGLFELFGYAPMLPLVLHEKGALRHSRALSRLGSVLAGVDHAVYSLVSNPARGVEPVYADALVADVGAGRRTGASVVLVLPPHRDGDDERQRNAVAAATMDRFGDDARVRLVDLHHDADLSEPSMWLNQVDLASAGIARVSQSIAPAVTALVRRALE
jgi:hypothetical protein